MFSNQISMQVTNNMTPDMQVLNKTKFVVVSEDVVKSGSHSASDSTGTESSLMSTGMTMSCHVHSTDTLHNSEHHQDYGV